MLVAVFVAVGISRSPHGERGLKSYYFWLRRLPHWSLPSRGAWIEIVVLLLLVREVKSLPSRGAWIEIHDWGKTSGLCTVAPLTGSVD